MTLIEKENKLSLVYVLKSEDKDAKDILSRLPSEDRSESLIKLRHLFQLDANHQQKNSFRSDGAWIKADTDLAKKQGLDTVKYLAYHPES